MKFNYLLIFILLLLYSCLAIKDKNNQSDTLFKKLAFEKYRNDTVCFPSAEQNYILCIKNNKESILNPNSLNEFFVFSNVSQKIVYQNSIAGARVSWTNDTLLLISQQKGTVISNVDSGKIQYFWDVKNNAKAHFIDIEIINK